MNVLSLDLNTWIVTRYHTLGDQLYFSLNEKAVKKQWLS